MTVHTMMRRPRPLLYSLSPPSIIYGHDQSHFWYQTAHRIDTLGCTQAAHIDEWSTHGGAHIFFFDYTQTRAINGKHNFVRLCLCARDAIQRKHNNKNRISVWLAQIKKEGKYAGNTYDTRYSKLNEKCGWHKFLLYYANLRTILWILNVCARGEWKFMDLVKMYVKCILFW